MHELGAGEVRPRSRPNTPSSRVSETEVEERELARIAAYFAPPQFERLTRWSPKFEEARLANPAFARWVRTNVAAHFADGYAIVNISLKPEGGIPGDATSEQMELVADLGRGPQLQRDPRQPCAEPRSSACEAR